MKIVQVGAIATGTVIIFGIFLVVPVFFPPSSKLPVLLTFDIVDNNNLPDWCTQLSSVLKKHDISAVVFVTGKIAQQYPQCVSGFSNKVDVGSQTYDYSQLTSISDYSQQLEEIKNGKIAVDTAGNLDSKLFRAPYGATDANIYSLLERSSILADFSYKNQYNKYYNGQFIKFDLISYDSAVITTTFIEGLSQDKGPVSIYYDNSTPVDKIDNFISKLDQGKTKFVNASYLTGLDLTVRKGGWFS
ncbi:MAG: polysaccharide deacetylase family protein [Nitrosopumilaceae archaeon]